MFRLALLMLLAYHRYILELSFTTLYSAATCVSFIICDRGEDTPEPLQTIP